MINGVAYVTRVISRGRIIPADEDLREYWTYKTFGASKPWFIRAATGQAAFWRDNDKVAYRTRTPESEANALTMSVGVKETEGASEIELGNQGSQSRVLRG